NAPYSTQRGSLEITIKPHQMLGADYNAHTELRNLFLFNSVDHSQKNLIYRAFAQITTSQ
ncbi:hypothetical protein R7190_26690, partial [Vibrio sp. 1078-1]|uniref:hypothetical protein n=1 Tax=Vibrio sp. 1078-1 TaxID=3074544 RepID=UPI0029642E33